MKALKLILVLGLLAGAALLGNSVLAVESGTNVVSVSSCEQVGSDVRISRNNGPKYMLTSSARNAGHGLRQYTLTCVSNTQYRVYWTTAITTTPGTPTVTTTVATQVTAATNCPTSGCTVPYATVALNEKAVAGFAYFTSMATSGQSSYLTSLSFTVTGSAVNPLNVGNNKLMAYVVRDNVIVGQGELQKYTNVNGVNPYFSGTISLLSNVLLTNNTQSKFTILVPVNDTDLTFSAYPNFRSLNSSLTRYQWTDIATGLGYMRSADPILTTPGGMYMRTW